VYVNIPATIITSTTSTTTTTTIAPTTTSTTTECQRPIGLTNGNLIEAVSNDLDPIRNFRNVSVEYACETFNYFRPGTNGTTAFWGIQYSFLTIGELIYLDHDQSNCNSTRDGYYWFQPNTDLSPPDYFRNIDQINIVTIVNGQITAINECNYIPTTTTTTLAPTTTTSTSTSTTSTTSTTTTTTIFRVRVNAYLVKNGVTDTQTVTRISYIANNPEVSNGFDITDVYNPNTSALYSVVPPNERLVVQNRIRPLTLDDSFTLGVYYNHPTATHIELQIQNMPANMFYEDLQTGAPPVAINNTPNAGIETIRIPFTPNGTGGDKFRIINVPI
jgi:hypothetical protein